MPFTITWQRRSVIGSKRLATALGTFTIPGADTWNTNLKIIESVQVTSNNVNAAGATVAGGIITLQGVAGPVSVTAIGH